MWQKLSAKFKKMVTVPLEDEQESNLIPCGFNLDMIYEDKEGIPLFI